MFQTRTLKFLAGVGFATFLCGSSPALAAATPPTPGTWQSFAVLGGSTVTNTGNSLIYGNLGLFPGTSITGFPPGIVVAPGTVHQTDSVADIAQTDATTTYNSLTQACDATISADLGTLTLAPGVYCSGSSMGLTGTLHLSGSGIWIFRMGSTLTTASSSSIVFDGTGSACDVYWQVGSSATLGSSSSFVGNIFAAASIDMGSGANIVGRALAARVGAVTLRDNKIDASSCPGAPSGAPVGTFKSFSPGIIKPGGTSTLTITFTNASSTTATLITTDFVDTLPSGMTIVGSPSTTCGGTAPFASGSSVTLPVGATIPAAVAGVPGSCTVTVNVTSSTLGAGVNTLPILVTDQGSNLGGGGATLFVTDSSIPTLSGRAMIMLAALLALSGFVAIRRLT